ncbi:MAG: pilin [Patescibacteria group bacterium]|jgi:hypothetical protein
MEKKKNLNLIIPFFLPILAILLFARVTSAVTIEELQALSGRMEADCTGIEPATRTLTDLNNRITALEESKNRNQETYDRMRPECGISISIADCEAQNELLRRQITQLLDLISQRTTEVEKAQTEIDKCQAAIGASQTATGSGTGTATTGPVEWTSPIGAISPTQLIGKAIKAVLGILGAVALLIFVYGGFVWMTSGGSPEKIKTARMTLVWAVLGMAVIFLSYAAVDFVLKAFGV